MEATKVHFFPREINYVGTDFHFALFQESSWTDAIFLFPESHYCIKKWAYVASVNNSINVLMAFT